MARTLKYHINLNPTSEEAFQQVLDEYKGNGKVDIIKGGPYKVRKELTNLIEYFEKVEEYERCGKLKQMREKYYGLS